MVGVRYLTRFLPPSVYGKMALALTIGTLVQQVFLGPCINGLLRYFSQANEDGLIDSYLRAGMKLFAEATLGVLLIVVATIFSLEMSHHQEWIGTVLAGSLFTVLSGYNSALDGIQNGARKRAVVAWHQGISQWLRFSAAVAATIIFGISAEYALCGYCVGVAIVAASQTFFLHRMIPWKGYLPNQSQNATTSVLHKQMRTYAWPFAVWGVFAAMQFTADRWALKIGVNSETVGYYAVLYQLGFAPMLLLSNVLVQLVAPILFQRAGAGDNPERVRKAFQLNWYFIGTSLTVTLIGSGGMGLFHRQIFSLLAAPNYRAVSNLLPWLGLAGGLFSAGQIATLSLLSDANPKALLLPKTGCALMAVLLYFTVVWDFGLAGVIAAVLLVSAVYLVWILCITAKRQERCASGTIVKKLSDRDPLSGELSSTIEIN